MTICYYIYMQNYEITCLVSPELSEEETQKIQEKASSFIQSEEGAVIEIKSPAKKISFFGSGPKETVSFTLEFQVQPENLKNLDKKLKEQKEIIRFFIITKPKFKEIARQRKRETKKPLKSSEEPKVKVEIAQIEKKLEEILGQ